MRSQRRPRGVAPHSVVVLHRRNAPQKLSMYALSAGVLLVPSRPLTASPWPPPGCGRGWPDAPVVAGDIPPAALAPRLANITPSQKAQGHSKSLARPLRFLRWCDKEQMRVAPSPKTSGRRRRCGASSLASVWARSFLAGGLAGAPLSPLVAALLRASPLLLPRRGTDARARPRSPTAFVPRRERVFLPLRRQGVLRR